MLKHITKLLLKFLILCILAGGVAAYWAWHEYSQFMETPLNLPSEGLTFEIPKGASVTSIARRLESQQVISKALWLRLQARLQHDGTSIKAGEYKLKPGLTPASLLALFV